MLSSEHRCWRLSYALSLKLSNGPKLVRSDWLIEDKFSVGHFDFKMSKNSTLGLLEGPSNTLRRMVYMVYSIYGIWCIVYSVQSGIWWRHDVHSNGWPIKASNRIHAPANFPVLDAVVSKHIATHRCSMLHSSSIFLTAFAWFKPIPLSRSVMPNNFTSFPFVELARTARCSLWV